MDADRGTLNDPRNDLRERSDLGLQLRILRQLPLKDVNKNRQFISTKTTVVLCVLAAIERT